MRGNSNGGRKEARGVRFTVPGTPVAKARPRVDTRGARPRTYTPDNTASFENRVRLFATEAGARLLEGPVGIVILAGFPMPKGDQRKRTPQPMRWRPRKPDLDNVVKAVKDALNGIAYSDDGQVVEIRARKVDMAQGEPARTIVTVRELAPLSAERSDCNAD